MMRSIQWDIYTILMVALVPVILLSAWGLHTWDERRLHNRQCEVALEWLEESAEIAPQFVQADSMERTFLWRSNFEEINSPAHASMLRDGILRSARYNAEHRPDDATDEPGVLHPQNGLFSREIEGGKNTLTGHCPETAALIPDAFPMVFPREDTN